MAFKRPINIERVAKLQKAFAKEYSETGLISVSDDYVQIDNDTASEVAPLKKWKQQVKDSETYTVTVDGVKFVTIVYKDQGEKLR